MMHNFKVTGGDVPQDATNKMFSAISDGDSKHSTTYTSGWISLNATISFDRESRLGVNNGPNYVHIYVKNVERLQVKGDKYSVKSFAISLSQYFRDDFVNGDGPIRITADNNKSSNAQQTI